MEVDDVSPRGSYQAGDLQNKRCLHKLTPTHSCNRLLVFQHAPFTNFASGYDRRLEICSRLTLILAGANWGLRMCINKQSTIRKYSRQCNEFANCWQSLNLMILSFCSIPDFQGVMTDILYEPGCMRHIRRTRAMQWILFSEKSPYILLLLYYLNCYSEETEMLDLYKIPTYTQLKVEGQKTNERLFIDRRHRRWP